MQKRTVGLLLACSASTVYSQFLPPHPLPAPSLPAPSLVARETSSRALAVQVIPSDSFSSCVYQDRGLPPVYPHTAIEVPSDGVVYIAPANTLSAMSYHGYFTEVSSIASQAFGGKSMISAGGYHMTAISKANGTLWCWGWQANGRLGNQTTTGISADPILQSPLQVVPRECLCACAGLSHTVGMDRTLRGDAWGSNVYGELANVMNTDSAIAYYTSDTTDGSYMDNCFQAAAGEHTSGILRTDGSVWAAGLNTKGQLARGNFTGSRNYMNPVLTDNSAHDVLTSIKEIEFGSDFCLAREAFAGESVSVGNGQVWVWGGNSLGQLGLGNTSNQSYATKAKLNASTYLTDATSISGGDGHAAIVRWKDGDANLQGSVWTMGNRANGRLGDGTTVIGTAQYPVQVVKADGSPLNHIIQVSAGSCHTLALDDDGHVWAWGYNGYGALGDGTTTVRPYAIKVQNSAGTGDLSDIETISAGGNGFSNFSAAVGSDGTVYTWGINTYGQLGLGVVGGSYHLPTAVPNFSLAN